MSRVAILLSVVVLLWSGPLVLDRLTGQSTGPSTELLADERTDEKVEYYLVDWVELIPEDDLQALLNPPDWISEIVDGSPEDDAALLSSSSRPMTEQEERYQEALYSKTVVPEFDDRAVRIPGFVVPLSFDDQRRVIEFFLVPYFGACLHLPPPPPNQIIYINYERGLEQESLYTPYWVEGTLRTQVISNEVADSAYVMMADAVTIYKE